MSRAPRLAYPIPSCLKARVVSPIGWVGKSAKQMEMSIAVMTSSTTLLNFSVSKVPSSFKNFNKFKEAKLQEELSKDMYSEHGLDAVIFPCSGVVCQSLIVSSYCSAGSAHSHEAWAKIARATRREEERMPGGRDR